MLDLTIYPIAAIGLTVLVQICKRWIKPKYGDIGIQLFIALLAFLFAGLWFTRDFLSVETLGILTSLWVAANGFYQIFLKHIYGAIEKYIE